MTLLRDVVDVQPKSRVKAGDGLSCGKYKFFTSSNIQTKWLNEYQYDKPALIFGTGGMPSVHFCDTPFSTSTDCVVMYSKTDMNLAMVYYYLSSNMHLLDEGFHGIGLKHISKDYILNFEIPELNEQTQCQIVATAGMLTNIIDLRKQQLAKLDELVKSRFVEMFGDPIHPLRFTKLGDVALLERGRFSPRPRNDPKYFNGDYPFIQTGDIANCNHRLSDYKQTLNELGIKVSKLFKEGTIVIAIVGATIGATAILEREVYAPDSVIGISAKEDKCVPIFLEILLQFWQPELQRIAPESARANINLAILKEIPIVQADSKLQEEFSKFVRATDKLKFEIQKSLEKLETLKKALMQQYFE
ncbi:MAG: restriction endonuclease subunit S [Oscillospiraceae bacterium]|nr:restriction endonuclease subunit S [Oscillospiraceae bacterium]